MSDAIKPDHYKAGNALYSCIDVIEDLCKNTKNDTFTDYNRFQAFKYIWRAGNKDPVLQDLKKAAKFFEFICWSINKSAEFKSTFIIK